MPKLYILYSKKFKNRILVEICQEIMCDCYSQYVAIRITDELLKQSIFLRLSTFRKIVEFVGSKGLLKARRLTFWELLKSWKK
jgi:hypothetical protein